MREPIFTANNGAARPRLSETDPEAHLRARDRALLHRGINLAIESAFRFGQDLPVGAVAAAGKWIVGRHFSSDHRVGYRQTHAEYMAVIDGLMSQVRSGTPAPDTVVVTIEPCDACQDFLATVPNVKRVGFGLTRSSVEDRGLIKRHNETIFQRALRIGLPYEIVQINDPELAIAGNTLLDYVQRDPQSEQVTVDTVGLQKALTELNHRFPAITY